MHNIDAIVEAAGLTNEDRGVSWLPLYHDMGLIGLLMTPMLIGFDLVLAAPTDFLAAPGDWLRWMSDYRGTVTCAPNFGYALAARALRRLDGLDLSSWRLGLNGAEPIDPDAVERFLAAGRAATGSTRASALCVYGMAEATLAISFPDARVTGWPSTRSTATRSSASATPTPRRAGRARRLARLGRPLRGLEVRVVRPGHGRGARASARSASSRCGARPSPPATTGAPEVSAASRHDDWLRTGDLGYLVDGEVVVCGRLKDVIIIGGRNVFPEEIERAAAGVDGVRPGNVVAFGMPGRRGKEGIVVVAETRIDDPRHAPRRRGRPGLRRRRRPAARGGPGAGRQPAQDLVGQAAAVPLPGPVPRRRARPPWRSGAAPGPRRLGRPVTDKTRPDCVAPKQRPR